MYILLFAMILTGLFSLFLGMGVCKPIRNGNYDGTKDGERDRFNKIMQELGHHLEVLKKED